jgi:hypothetical protein
MDLDSLNKLFGQEWATIVGAPGFFIAAIFVVGFCIWKIMGWRYDGILASKDATIAHLEKVIETREIMHSVAESTAAVAIVDAATSDSDREVEQKPAQTDEPQATIGLPQPVALPDRTEENLAPKRRLVSTIPAASANERMVSIEELRALYRPELSVGEQEDIAAPYQSNPFRISGIIRNISRIGSAYSVILGSEDEGSTSSNVVFTGNEIISMYRNIRVGSKVTLRAQLNSINQSATILTNVQLLEIEV